MSQPGEPTGGSTPVHRLEKVSIHRYRRGGIILTQNNKPANRSLRVRAGGWEVQDFKPSGPA